MVCSAFFNLSFIFLFLIYSYTNHVHSGSSSSSIIPTRSSPKPRIDDSNNSNKDFVELRGEDYCLGVHDYTDYNSKCVYVKSHSSCLGKGFINYLEIFYCNFGGFPALGYVLLVSWLIVLFYLVGNTTAEYFVPSVEGLSVVLNLSPTISGTTLLPLGNGANDVFASVISFTKSHDADVGFNSVLGGVFFISCFVVGIVAFTTTHRRRQTPSSINEASFVRDVIFLILALFFLLIILILGRINLVMAICYVSLYFGYIGVVSAMHFFSSATSPSSEHHHNNNSSYYGDNDDIGIPLIIGYVDEEKSISTQNYNINIINSSSGDDVDHQVFGLSYPLRTVLSVLELPLYLPRRITIPVVKEERWSKTLAVSSAILAPVMLVAVWGSQLENYMAGGGSRSSTRLYIYLGAGFVGLILGFMAFNFTKKTSPPAKEYLLPWLMGGFIMSITWTYLIVEELVSLLVSFGNIFEISPSLLGLTVLAWGNSLGDLISNVTMALHDDGDDGGTGSGGGTQIAMSGCYAGPLFNTLIGLGLSLVLASWKEYPSPYMVPRDPYLYQMVGFIIAALLWALVILLKKNMQLDRYLGLGLLAIYTCFLVLTFAKALGFLPQ